jgi:hypothetical protein
LVQNLKIAKVNDKQNTPKKTHHRLLQFYKNPRGAEARLNKAKKIRRGRFSNKIAKTSFSLDERALKVIIFNIDFSKKVALPDHVLQKTNPLHLKMLMFHEFNQTFQVDNGF